jgi:hypothetical protein
MIRTALPIAGLLAGASLVLAQATMPAATQPASAPASAPTSQAAGAGTMPAANALIPADLAKTMQNAIALTEAGNYRDLIETLAPPEAIAQLKGAGRFDESVAGFGERAPMLLDALHQALALPPEMSDEGKTATFHITGPRPEMKFVQIEGKWYLR